MPLKSPKLIFMLGSLLGSVMTWLSQKLWPSIRETFYQWYFGYSDPHELGMPSQEPHLIILIRNGYRLGFDPDLCAARWTIHKLSRLSVSTKLVNKRASFLIDRDLPEECRVTSDVYEGTRWDRGHLVPNDDIQYHRRSNQQTFLMSNALPQEPELNRNAWKSLESKIRSWTYKVGELYVVTGAGFGERPQRIDRQVAIPRFFYKLVYSDEHQQAIAFCYPNEPVKARDLWEEQYVMSIEALERYLAQHGQPGVKFFDKISEDKRSALVQSVDRSFWINL